MSLSSHVWSYYRLLFYVCQGEGWRHFDKKMRLFTGFMGIFYELSVKLPTGIHF